MKRGPQVIGGSLAGLVLPFCQVKGVRPTLEIVRRSFFDIIERQVKGCVFIDAFAGSGIMGIEALSRGAAYACFLDSDLEVCHQIERILIQNGLDLRSRIIRGDVAKTIPECLDSSDQNIVFCDPPYQDHGMKALFDSLGQSDRQNSVSLLVIEHHHKNDPQAAAVGWSLTRQQKYGETRLTFLTPESILFREVNS